MPNAKNILNFSFEKSNWEVNSDTFFPAVLRKTLLKKQAELEELTAKAILASEPAKIPKPEIIYLYRQFFNLAPQGLSALTQEFNSSRKIRKLTAALSMRAEGLPSILATEYLELFLQLINHNWRDAYLKNLILALLKEWTTLKANAFNNKVYRLTLGQKLADYTGSRPSILRLMNLTDFFLEENGDELLAKKIITQQPTVASILQDLHLSEQMLSTSYFTTVFLKVAQYSIRTDLLITYFGLLSDYLNKTYDFSAPKKIIPLFISKVEKDKLTHLQQPLQKLAFSLIGDPARKDKWSKWSEATMEEIQILRDSRIIINRWINKTFIRVFFERISMDPDRKRFWLNYTDSMHTLYVYGHREQERRLKVDDTISPYLKERFRRLRSDSQGAALVIFFSDYLLIEFTEVGAVYCYRDSNPFVNKIIQNQPIATIPELKKPNMGMAINASYEGSSEGRIFHQGRWQDRMSNWLYRYPKIQTNRG